jgi:hypothetical protein
MDRRATKWNGWSVRDGNSIWTPGWTASLIGFLLAQPRYWRLPLADSDRLQKSPSDLVK